MREKTIEQKFRAAVKAAGGLAWGHMRRARDGESALRKSCGLCPLPFSTSAIFQT